MTATHPQIPPHATPTPPRWMNFQPQTPPTQWAAPPPQSVTPHLIWLYALAGVAMILGVGMTAASTIMEIEGLITVLIAALFLIAAIMVSAMARLRP